MIVSRCCKANLIHILDHYVCFACGRPCDTVSINTTEGQAYGLANVRESREIGKST